jgi:ATP-dependent Lon protease
MEVLQLPGYTEDEKVMIAERYLIPKQRRANGLREEEITITEDAVRAIVRGYTREAGVRNLERQVATVCRKVARELSEGTSNRSADGADAPDGADVRMRGAGDAGAVNGAAQRNASAAAGEAGSVEARGGAPGAGEISEAKAPAAGPVVVDAPAVRRLLGREQFRNEQAERIDRPGVATGLVWTPVGGDIVFVEAARMPGRESGLILTGQLGEVMKESAQAALTCVRSDSERLGIEPKLWTESAIHVHVPAGATPKDGPSAGVTMAVALASLMTGRPVRHDVAMTGEITLRGKVLPVGGIKEKMLGAHRAGIRTVLLPERNEGDLEDLPEEMRKEMQFIPVREIEQAFDVALTPRSVPQEVAAAPVPA